MLRPSSSSTSTSSSSASSSRESASSQIQDQQIALHQKIDKDFEGNIRNLPPVPQNKISPAPKKRQQLPLPPVPKNSGSGFSTNGSSDGSGNNLNSNLQNLPVARTTETVFVSHPELHHSYSPSSQSEYSSFDNYLQQQQQQQQQQQRNDSRLPLATTTNSYAPSAAPSLSSSNIASPSPRYYSNQSSKDLEENRYL